MRETGEDFIRGGPLPVHGPVGPLLSAASNRLESYGDEGGCSHLRPERVSYNRMLWMTGFG